MPSRSLLCQVKDMKILSRQPSWTDSTLCQIELMLKRKQNIKNTSLINQIKLYKKASCPQTWITTIVPTAVATWAALGVGGSPNGVILQKFSRTQIRNDGKSLLKSGNQFFAKQQSRSFKGSLSDHILAYLDHLFVRTS